MSNIHRLEHSQQLLYNTHSKDACVGDSCTIHKMSDHHMRSFPQYYRFDRGMMERLCPCGVGHPDPDDPSDFRLHECCPWQCCSKPADV